MPPAHDGLPPHAEPTSGATLDATPDIAARLLALLGELTREIRPSERLATTLTLDSHLERELALDSLARAELLQRIERTFHARLDERMLLAETPRDLLALILGTGGEPIGSASTATKPIPGRESTVTGTPEGAATLLDMLDWHERRHPDRVAIQIHGNDERIATTFTYTGLVQGARTVAAGLADARPATRPDRGFDAAHQRRLFPRLLRHPAGRRGAGADLSAGAALADRGTSAPPRPAADQRPDRGADHRARGEAGGAAASVPGRGAAPRRHGGGIAGGGDGMERRAGARRRSRLPAIHLRQHRRPQGGDADPRQPAGQSARHGSTVRGPVPTTCSSVGCRCITTWA